MSNAFQHLINIYYIYDVCYRPFSYYFLFFYILNSVCWMLKHGAHFSFDDHYSPHFVSQIKSWVFVNVHDSLEYISLSA